MKHSSVSAWNDMYIVVVTLQCTCMQLYSISYTNHFQYLAESAAMCVARIHVRNEPVTAAEEIRYKQVIPNQGRPLTRIFKTAVYRDMAWLPDNHAVF